MVDIPEHKKEHEKKEEHHKENDKKTNHHTAIRIMVIGFTLLVAGFLIGWLAMPSATTTTQKVTKEVAGQNVVKFLNDNLVEPGTSATLKSVVEENGVYKVTTTYQDQEIPVYTTIDGKLLFVQSIPLNLTITAQTDEPEQTGIQKSDKPMVELYVMSFCPYGVQAEQIMKPVYDALGKDADINIRFIANVGGTTPESVSSLHGTNEALEDMRQLCIVKNYGKDTYWKYLDEFDTKCYATYGDSSALNTCWKGIADKYAINTTKIENCVNTEGVTMMQAEEVLTQQYQVSGSPTLIINGVRYNGARSSAAFQSAICSAFTTPPAACSAEGIDTDVAPQGSC